MDRWLEKPVQPFLGPMIRGNHTTLTFQDRAYLSTWAVKVAMVARYTHKPPDPVAEDWLEFMHFNHLPPGGWHVWLASYDGARPLYYQGDGGYELLPDGGRTTTKAVVMTLVIGYVALKVVGSRQGAPQFHGSSAVQRLWPPFEGFGESIWPLSRHLDDAGLEKLVNAFLIPEQGKELTPLPPLREPR